MSRRKRIILVGRTMSGKTTLSQRITDSDIRYHKTQTLTLIDDFILDTPGEYFERYSFRGSLTVAATDADVIVFVQDATEDGTLFPRIWGAFLQAGHRTGHKSRYCYGYTDKQCKDFPKDGRGQSNICHKCVDRKRPG